MGKSKKKKGQQRANDTRGYNVGQQKQQPQQTSSRRPLPSTSAATTSTPDIIVTKQTHEEIRTLVTKLQLHQDNHGEEQHNDDVTGDARREITSSRFATKLTKVIDRLLELGFVYNDDEDDDDDDKHPDHEKNETDTRNYIQDMVIQLGPGITFDSALDWLCLHVPTLDLPPLLTDGQLRNNLLREQSTTTTEAATGVASKSLTVLQFVAAATAGPTSNEVREQQDTDPPMGTDTVIDTGSFAEQQKQQQKQQEEIERKRAQDEQKQQQQREWLLQQYAYEDDKEDDENRNTNNSNTYTTKIESGGHAGKQNEEEIGTATMEETTDSMTTTVTNTDNAEEIPITIPVSKVEVEFLQKQQDVEDFETDVNNEANNYMRSKQEIKQLKTTLKKMKQKLRGLQKKVEQIHRDQQHQQQQKELEPHEQQHNTETEEDEKEDGGEDFFGNGGDSSGGFFEQLERDDAAAAVAVAAATNDDHVAEKEDQEEELKAPLLDCGVPKGWTGTTPTQVLQDLCRKHKKMGRAKYIAFVDDQSQQQRRRGRKLTGINIQIAPIHGTRNTITIHTTNGRHREEQEQKEDTDGCWMAYDDEFLPVVYDGRPKKNTTHRQQHMDEYLALRTLWDIDANKPLYGLFPPLYRTLWLSWIDAVDTEKQRIVNSREEQSSQRIQKLIALLLLQQQQQHKPNRKPLQDEAKTAYLNTTPDGNEKKNNDTNIDPALVEESWEDLMVDDDDNTNTDSQNNHDPHKISITTSNNHQHNMLTSTRTRANTTLKGGAMKAEFVKRKSTKMYQHMLEQRAKLPMDKYREEVLDTIRCHPVTIICAETGAGKTTQCPQYLLEEAMMNGQGDRVNIICTQPRRVAATSVAERVADEMADRLGHQVGYQIRMESKRSKDTKLLFCTTGVILRRLQDDHDLKSITHVIVDEVHERQVQTDVLLIALRQLLMTTRRNDLKVILMSATMDPTLFSNFFNRAPVINVPGRTFPVSSYFLEDILDATGHIIEDGSQYARRGYEQNETTTLWVTSQGGTKHREVADLKSQTVLEVSEAYSGYSMSTRRSMERVNESIINFDLVEDVLSLLLIHPERNSTLHTPDGSDIENGSVLVFLPGIGEIRSLNDRLSANRIFGNKSKFSLIPLHSKLSSADQRKAFLPPKKGCRKIILSTNIAETSVTIQDVIVVIDCGREREVRRNKRTSTSILVTDWCSKANTKQRAGRAGRVQPGLCLKLFSSSTADSMKATSEPELKRVPLEEVCLSILASGLGKNCEEFLGQAPQPPSEEAVTAALSVLEEVGAVTSARNVLTPLGQHLSKLPVDVRLGKMLIFGALFQCLDTVVTIAASLSCKSPFATYLHDAALAQAKHKEFYDPNSDFITLCNVWDGYHNARGKSYKAGRQYCQANYLNPASMHEIDTTKKDFLNLLCNIGFISKQTQQGYHGSSSSAAAATAWDTDAINRHAKNWPLVHAIVFAGLNPNVARLESPSSSGSSSSSSAYTLWHKTQQLYFHRTSVNAKKKRFPNDHTWVVFFEKFGTPTRTSISTTCFLSNSLPLVLFSTGSFVVQHLARTLVVDDWMEIPMAAQIGVMLQQLRLQIEVLLLDLVDTTPFSSSSTLRPDDRKVALQSERTAIITGIVDIISRTTSTKEYYK